MGKMEPPNKSVPAETKFDPRVRDVVRFNRIRDLVDKEVLHQAWGCNLWKLERLEKITREERMAGDAYVNLTETYRMVLYNPIIDLTEPELDRIKRIKERYKESQELLAQGDIRIRRAVDDLCFEDLYPECEAGLRRVKSGLARLELFFRAGTKKEPKAA